MNSVINHMAESLNDRRAKKVLVLISKMHLEEYPLTSEDLAHLLMDPEQEEEEQS
jgi:hypothetical protein